MFPFYKKSKVLIVFVLLSNVSRIQAQDNHFSQFWMSTLIQNPGFVGVNHDVQAILNYKDQWRSVGSPFKTFNASFDMKLGKKDYRDNGFWAGGINLSNDRAGDSKMTTNQANLNLGYHFFINRETTIGGGLMGGVNQKGIDASDLQWGNQYNGKKYDSDLSSGESTTARNFAALDLGAGLVWAYKKGEAYISGNNQKNATVGFAVFHPNKPKYSFLSSNANLSPKFVFNANVLWGVENTNFSFAPSILFYSQGKAKELTFGSLFRFTLQEASRVTGYIQGSAFSLGAHYRSKDALIISSLYELGQFALGVSYDVNISKLTPASSGRGGIEFSLRFVNPNPFLWKQRARF